MARTMTVDSAEIYRALVTYVSSYSGKRQQQAYGPHDSKAHAQDYDARYRKGPTRVEKQVLAPVHTEEADGTPSLDLQWCTVDTKYTNGGEDVNWDD